MATDLADLGISDGLVAVVKRDCPACQLVVPVFEQLAEEPGLTVYSQDDPGFPTEADWVVDDTDLTVSWHLGIDAVPAGGPGHLGSALDTYQGGDRVDA